MISPSPPALATSFACSTMAATRLVASVRIGSETLTVDLGVSPAEVAGQLDRQISEDAALLGRERLGAMLSYAKKHGGVGEDGDPGLGRTVAQAILRMFAGVGQELLDDRIRYDMVASAVKDIPGIQASDFEFSLPKPSYTANTLRSLSASYPDREFILTIGADNWVKFDAWREYGFILRNYSIIVYPRQDCAPSTLPAGVTLLNCPLVNISSTRIRQLVHQGQPIDKFVPASVARTIADLQLYR